MHTLPIEPVFPRGHLPRFQADSTANWKGYHPTWSIRSGRLHLDSVTGRLARPGDTDLWGDGKGRWLASGDFKEGVRLPVFASWYSGEIIVPFGSALACTAGSSARSPRAKFISRSARESSRRSGPSAFPSLGREGSPSLP
jgi:hypothetical protein